MSLRKKIQWDFKTIYNKTTEKNFNKNPTIKLQNNLKKPAVLTWYLHTGGLLRLLRQGPITLYE